MENNTGYFNISQRTILIDKIDLIISQLQDRLSVQRFRPNEADNLKLEYIKVLLQAIKIENEILTEAQQDVYIEPYEPCEIQEPADSEPKKSLFDF